MSAVPTVVGLDHSLTGTGIASSLGWCEVIGWVDGEKDPATGVKRPPITKLAHAERRTAMRWVRDGVLEMVGVPDLVVLELPAPSRSGGGAHERAWLWWELHNALTDRGIPVALMTTNQRMLYATGKGNAAKTVVVDAVARRWPDWATEGNDNAADAVVLMAAGRDWLGEPVATVPQTHRKAIEKAVWPDLVPLLDRIREEA